MAVPGRDGVKSAKAVTGCRLQVAGFPTVELLTLIESSKFDVRGLALSAYGSPFDFG
jgi:hypothetical protein